jgi:hypothetical protein
MKRRLLSLLLAIALFCGMLPAMAAPVHAATKLDYAPYAKVEYDYTEQVKAGTIRYIRQNVDKKYF